MSDEGKVKRLNMLNSLTEGDEHVEHQAKLQELNEICQPLCDLVGGYFDPPNLMAWRGDGDWEVFIRRKGSDAEFSPVEWAESCKAVPGCKVES